MENQFTLEGLPLKTPTVKAHAELSALLLPNQIIRMQDEVTAKLAEMEAAGLLLEGGAAAGLAAFKKTTEQAAEREKQELALTLAVSQKQDAELIEKAHFEHLLTTRPGLAESLFGIAALQTEMRATGIIGADPGPAPVGTPVAASSPARPAPAATPVPTAPPAPTSNAPVGPPLAPALAATPAPTLPTAPPAPVVAVSIAQSAPPAYEAGVEASGVVGLCCEPFTPADLKGLLLRLGVVNSAGTCLTNDLQGKARGQRGAFAAAYRVLHRAGLLNATITDREWADVFKREYGADLGAGAIAHQLTAHGQAKNLTPGPFQKAVDKADVWVKEWQADQKAILLSANGL